MNIALRKLLKAILFLYAVWLVTCLLVVMPALNFLAPGLVRDNLDRELRSELLLFNPFSLALDARGVELTERDGHRPVAFARLLIDLSLESLWSPGVVLDRLWIRELDVHVLRHSDGGFHFDDLLADSGDNSAGGDAPIPAVTIHDLFVDAHTLAYTDRTRPGRFRTVQSDLVMRLQNLTTAYEREGDGVLELIGDGGGALRWEGVTDISAGRSRGRLELTGIDLTNAWRYEAGRLAFIANSARLDAAFTYSADWSATTDLNIEDGRLRLHGIDVTPAAPGDHPDTHVRLADVLVDGIAIGLGEERVAIDTVTVRGADIAGFDRDGRISLVEMFEPVASGGAGAAAVLPAASAHEESAADSEWQLSLAKFIVDDSVITWRTPLLAPEVVRVQPLRLGLSAIHWPARGDSRLELSLAVNETMDLRVAGTIDIGTGAGEVDSRLSGLQLAWLNPLVHQQLRTDLARGTVDLQSRVTLQDFAPGRIAAELRVLDLVTVLHETGDEAFRLEQFAVDGASIDVANRTAAIAAVRLQRPEGSLHIREGGQININGIVRETAAQSDVARPGGNTSASVAADEAWRVLLDHVVLEDGRLDFADDSLPLPFRAMIGDIAADLRDLDTASQKSLTLAFNGNVDGYAPVVIEGRGTPLADRADAELRLRFRGVDIATMSPYSGTYAGYTIDSGTLSLDLRYALSGQEIDGDNRIVISQMELGQPIESDLAVEVPLKLGIALLTDASGVIDLSVPVSGNVNDPEFGLGRIIGRAIMNVITKAVTAPFKLLAGLVGSNADLENVAFAPGSAAIDRAATDALNALAEALAQRPQLNLRIEGGSDPTLDGRALREASIEQDLAATGLPAESIKARDAAFNEAVAARFATLPGTDSDSTGDGERPGLQAMWDALVAAEPLTPSALETLASARAAAAKRELVTAGGIDAARIAISYDRDAATAGIHMRVDG